jgi:hypothetical protein
MALDPSIALQIQPVQLQNPLTQYAQISAIQNAQQQNALTGLAIQDKQREIGQAQALNDAFKAPGNVNADGTLNSSGIVSSVASSGNGAAVPGLVKSLAETQTAQLTQQKTKVDLATQQLNAVGQVLNGVHDQATWDAARQWAHTNLGGSALDNAPAAYDPTVIATAQQQALTTQQALDQHSKQIDQALQQSQFEETQRHNQATEASTTRGQNLTAATETRGQDLRAREFDPKNGVIVNKITGQSTPVMGASGQPIGGTANNLTQDQSNAVAFGARALDAQGTLRQLEAGGTTNSNAVNRAVSALPGVGGALGAATNWLNSDQQQSYQQAKSNFITAVLRKESGASIAPAEFDTEDKKYFPQPGDSAATIEQKARARDLAIEGLKAQAGQGASLIPGIISSANQDYSTQPRAGQPAAVPQQQSGAVQTGQPQQQAQSQPQAAAQPRPAAAIAPDTALAELRRRAATNPALAARLAAMGH